MVNTIHKLTVVVMAVVFCLGAKPDSDTDRLNTRLYLSWNELRIPADRGAMLVAPGQEEIVKVRARNSQAIEVSDCQVEGGSCQVSGAVVGINTPKNSGNYKAEFTVTDSRSRSRRVTLTLLVGFSNSLLINGVINDFQMGIYPVNKNLPWSTQVPAHFFRLDYGMLGLSISSRFKLGDLGYDGRATLPQYFALDYELVKKLEVVGDELKARGLPSRYHFIGGGFISPKSNGVRTSKNGAAATQSRHMWGEAVDFIIDDDRNEIMDDMNGDHVINPLDTFVVRDLVTELEGKKKVKAGGFGIYAPPRNRALTMHVDVRGYPTRWGVQQYSNEFSGVAPKESLRPGGS